MATVAHSVTEDDAGDADAAGGAAGVDEDAGAEADAGAEDRAGDDAPADPRAPSPGAVEPAEGAGAAAGRAPVASPSAP
ncbi:hypothetical protein ACFFN3_20525, partial [Leifsonia shinshuensis]